MSMIFLLGHSEDILDMFPTANAGHVTVIIFGVYEILFSSIYIICRKLR